LRRKGKMPKDMDAVHPYIPGVRLTGQEDKGPLY
jgi:hypothetical protein